jgi:uncharacterized protein YajQ (UPF0234 family)
VASIIYHHDSRRSAFQQDSGKLVVIAFMQAPEVPVTGKKLEDIEVSEIKKLIKDSWPRVNQTIQFFLISRNV